jgi:hypothetical protein
LLKPGWSSQIQKEGVALALLHRLLKSFLKPGRSSHALQQHQDHLVGCRSMDPRTPPCRRRALLLIGGLRRTPPHRRGRRPASVPRSRPHSLATRPFWMNSRPACCTAATVTTGPLASVAWRPWTCSSKSAPPLPRRGCDFGRHSVTLGVEPVDRGGAARSWICVLCGEARCSLGLQVWTAFLGMTHCLCRLVGEGARDKSLSAAQVNVKDARVSGSASKR